MNRAEKRRQQKMAKKAAKNKKPLPLSSSLPAQTEQNIQQVLELAVQHHSTGRLSEAEKLYNQVLLAAPNHPVALHLLGVVSHQMGKDDKAVDLIRMALTIQPDYAEAHSNLGNILKQQGREKLNEAIASYRQALAIKPDYAEARYNLANALKAQGKLDEAVASYRAVLALKPDYAKVYINLGNTLKEMGQLVEAVASFRDVLAIQPDHAEAHNSLGVALEEQGKLDEAYASYREALAIEPDYDKAHYNMGTSLMELGRTLEAATCFNRALDLNPGYDKALSNLIFLQDLLPDLNQAQQQQERQRWNETFIVSSADRIKPHTNNKTPDRRLRIGYVSGDFYRHSASKGFAPLILQHDRDRFDVFCYDNNPSEDETARALRDAATEWRAIDKMDDDELAEIIRGDAIDILVDLSAHTRDNRLKVFGHKAAPVQVCGIGHLAPGLSTVDYRLTTPILTPPEEEALYPEQPIYLKTYFGLTPPENAPPTSTLPCLEKGFFTYGFLGRHTKITPQVVETWARILRDTPNSRLLLKHRQLDTPTDIDRTLEDFSKLGIAADRLILRGLTDHATHLKAHDQVDLVLDTFPHGGGITALESLWMGVPLIGINDPSKAGGRIPAMISEPLGLGGFVVDTPEAFHDTAVAWSGHIDALSLIRQNLRERLVDLYESFPNDVEKAYREIWSRWCKGEAPSPLPAP